MTLTHRHKRNKQNLPRPNTKGRVIYDTFTSNEGEPVNGRELAHKLKISVSEFNNTIKRLNDSYALYIVNQGEGYYILLNEEEWCNGAFSE